MELLEGLKEELKKELYEVVVEAIRATQKEDDSFDELRGWREIEDYTNKNKRTLQNQIREGIYLVDGRQAISYNRKSAWGSKRLIQIAEGRRIQTSKQ